MPETPLRQDSLVLYKNRPARIHRAGAKKVEIGLEDGRTLSVRPKDITLLHPGPLHNLAELVPPQGDVTTAWELLAGETVTLPELAELAYGDYTPATAWATWQLVDDGLYFSGTPEAITAHSATFVAEEQAARETKAAEEQAWAAFLARVTAGRFVPEDGRYLEEVVALALGQREQSRVLRALGQAETLQSAHALLLAIGYWDVSYNPYPARLGMQLTPPTLPLPPLPDESRRDLTHLPALAIDDEGSQDPDDALSLADSRLWVHIADTAALVPPDSPADLEARARGVNLYLPEGKSPMLPPVATSMLALGLAAVSPALSFGVDFGPVGEITGLEIVPSWVRVTRLTYEEAETRLAESPLRELLQLADRRQVHRQANGAIEIDLPEVKVRVAENGAVVIRPLPALRSRALVREAMLMTGEAVGRFALEHHIPLPFTTQAPPNSQDEPGANAIDPGSPAGMFALRRTLKPGRPQSTPAPHTGLGLEVYVQCTSPLRRYLDLVVHQQLRAFLRGERLLDEAGVMARVGAAEAVVGDARRAERLSIRHWTMVYLLQNPDWRGEGVIVEKRGARDLILIPALALETQLYQSRNLPLNSPITLALSEVNVPALEAHFRPI